MEIGSAYALQVCLLQIPALVAVSAFLNSGKLELKESTFSLIFPQWDLITVILCVFLLAYMYGEGKSNYFKVRPKPDSFLIVGKYFDACIWRCVDGWIFYPSFPRRCCFGCWSPQDGGLTFVLSVFFGIIYWWR